jgi:(4-(4-[2-(gamma-L-glutamylamino)ethyl]phenoxymethyl)furan-2-yl)methanamine synthase
MNIVGWDIGGANLKAVMLDANGDWVDVLQIPCELWRGLDRLRAGIHQVVAQFGIAGDSVKHAVTMTGELVDLFANRRDGVLQITALITELFGEDVRYYAAQQGFVRNAMVASYVNDIASANWHASASLIGCYVADAVVVDMGSTTTDIIPISNGKVPPIGMSDALRLREDTLLYTGVVRTPVMAVANKLVFEGVETNVAAEYFATMADVYRLTGELAPTFDMAETADGRGKTKLDSARRLARMIGYDVEDRPLKAWRQLAIECRSIQETQMMRALQRHSDTASCLVGLGAGAFLVQSLARSKGLFYKSLEEVISSAQDERISVCFPAYAVARLAHLEGEML